MGLSASWRAALAAGAVNLVLGANLPYLPVWMERAAGMSGAEIAGASTLAILIRIFAGPLTGWLDVTAAQIYQAEQYVDAVLGEAGEHE